MRNLAIILPLAAALCLCPPARAAVFIIGLDGADPAVTAEMIKAGKMPNLAAVFAQGVSGRLDTRAPLPLSSPVIWTSMATGKNVEKHGITGFVKPGTGTFYRTSDRTAPALWNMVSSQGLTVNVVGYLMTYPAETVNGVMVSNNYFMPGGAQSVVSPPGLKLKTSRAQVFVSGTALRDAAAIAGLTRPELLLLMPSLDTYDSADFRKQYLFEKLLQYTMSDEGFASLSEELLGRGKPDLFMLYLPGIDRVSHLAWGQAGEPGKAFGNLVRAYYAYTDRLLGRVLAHAGKEDTVIIVSDHGFRQRKGAGPLTVVSGDHRPGGIFAARGPDIRRGARLKAPVTDWDITPTALYLLGLPVAKDMDGAPALALFKGGVLPGGPPAYMDAYLIDAEEEASEEKELPFTPQELERLKLSGYTQ